MYTSESTFRGDLSSTAAAVGLEAFIDQVCQAEVPQLLRDDCETFVAVLDTEERRIVDYGDRFNISAQARVDAPEGPLLEAFSQLFEPGVQLLNFPDAVGFEALEYWTGFSPTADDAVNCEWWASGQPGVRGVVGDAGRDDVGWLESRTAVCDEATIHLLCSCW